MKEMVRLKEGVALCGAVLAAVTASLCCGVGPLLVAVFGVGMMGAARAFASARPYLLTGAVLLLSIAYYWTYFKRDADCAHGQECAPKTASRLTRIGLWLAVLIVLFFVLMPYLTAPLFARLGGG
jgi:Na+-driven multidrug efflux pump